MARGKTKEELAEISKGTRFNSETAKEAQKKSVIKRFENRSGAELALAILRSPIVDQNEIKRLQEELGTTEELTQEVAMDTAMLRASKGCRIVTPDGVVDIPANPNAYEKLMKKAGIYTEKKEIKADKPVFQLVVAQEVADRNGE